MSAALSSQASREAELFEIESWADLVGAAPPPLAQATGLAAEKVSGLMCIIAPGIPSNEFNRCVGLGVSKPATQTDVDALLDHYRAHGAANAWIQIMDGAAPGSLRQWLTERGASPASGGWVIFDRGTQPAEVRSSPLQVREVRPEEAMQAAAVFRTGYGMPPPFDGWVAMLCGRPGWRMYSAFDGEMIVATALLRQSGTRAIFAGAATLPSARGKGAQSALMALRLKEAAASGVTVVQSHTWLPAPGGKNPSLDNMRRCGFRQLHTRTNYSVGTG